MSAAQDSTLRSFSTETDLLNKNFGVASYNRKLSKKHKKLENPVKMNPITGFTSETSKENEWDNIACVHEDTCVVTTWSFQKQRMGELKLRHQRFKEDKKLRESKATCLNLSICGNFVMIGYDSGHLDKFNIQSGIFRGSFETSKTDPKAHSEKVQAIISDGLNQTVVSADCGKNLKFWKFQDHHLKDTLCADANILDLILHRESALLVIVMENRSINIMDLITQKIVRKFFDVHQDQLSEVCISPDSRWMITSSVDKTMKIWDIPSGNLIDYLIFSSPITSLSMSPTSDFLATTHKNDLGVYLWSNKSLYGHISLKPLDTEEEPISIKMPRVKHVQSDLANDLDKMDIEEENLEDEEVWRQDQLSQELITLSGLPPARWQNLHNLEVIKARNKPKEVINKPKNAPFFLPTVTGPDGQTRFNLDNNEEGDGQDQNAKKPVLQENFTQFGQKLWDSRQNIDSSTLIGLLKEMGPSSIDMEIISLSPEGGGSIELMGIFLQLLQNSLEAHQDFEAVHAYLGLFLKHHSDTILNNVELVEALERLKPVAKESWQDLKMTLSSASTLVNFAKNSLLT